MSLLTGHRVETVRAELLTYQDSSQGFLDGVAGGVVRWNANARVPGAGELALVDRGQDVDYSRDRIRLWWGVHSPNDPEQVEEWPMGVFVLAAPGTAYRASYRSRNLTLIDKLTVVADDCILETLQVPAGANAISAAVDQIYATGEARVAVTPSDRELVNDMTWPPGTSRLRVINDLLTYAGYWALWTDRFGQFRLEPYIAPAQRPVAWRFVEGAASIHSPNWEYELALWDATNLVVLTSPADENGDVWKASAVDDNPDSPTSTVRMNRVLNPMVEENVEAASAEDLQAQCDRRLIDNSNVVGRIQVSHAAVPVWYNEAVYFESQGFSATATVTEMSLGLTPGSLVNASWRQV